MLFSCPANAFWLQSLCLFHQSKGSLPSSVNASVFSCLMVMQHLPVSVTFPHQSDFLLKQLNVLQTKNLTKSQRFIKFRDISVHVFKISRVKGSTLTLPTTIFLKKENHFLLHLLKLLGSRSLEIPFLDLWYLCGCYSQRTEFILLYPLKCSIFFHSSLIGYSLS